MQTAQSLTETDAHALCFRCAHRTALTLRFVDSPPAPRRRTKSTRPQSGKSSLPPATNCWAPLDAGRTVSKRNIEKNRCQGGTCGAVGPLSVGGSGCGRCSRPAPPAGTAGLRSPIVFLLHSLSIRSTEIPERFSSSLLPPYFAAGRCAAIFNSGGTGESAGPPRVSPPMGPGTSRPTSTVHPSRQEAAFGFPAH